MPSAETPATFINLISAAAWQPHTQISGYALSKLAATQFTTYIGTAYPNITAIALHPGILETDMLHPSYARFDLNSTELIGGLAVWLSGERARFLSGRVMNANWDVEELVQRKKEIEEGGDLKLNLVGKFGDEYGK